MGPVGPAVATAYLTAPGVELTITSAEVTADRRVAVTWTITDPGGLPLDRAGVVTQGAFNPNFVFAQLDPAAGRYVSFLTRTETAGETTTVQATGENSGTTTELSIGAYRTESNLQLPEGLDPATTLRVGMYGTRPFEGLSYAANATHDFTPSGAAPVLRELVVAESCNACHGELRLHGGARRDPRLCVECHSPLTTDAETGNVLDLSVMVHRIHMGVDLPSVVDGPVGAQYAVSGFQDRLEVFAERVGPEPGDVIGVRYPQEQRRCATCHAAAPQGDQIWTLPAIAVCTACHDATAFVDPPPAGMTLHSGGVQTDDTCIFCHGPGSIFAVEDLHRTTEAFLADQGLLAGLQLSIESVTSVAPGSSPAVTFRATDASGQSVAPSSLGRIRATIAGPAEDPTFTLAALDLTAATDNGDGTFTQTVSSSLPADLDPGEAILVGLEGRRTITATRGGREVTFNEGAFNPLAYVTADGTDSPAPEPEPIVAQERCDACHGNLRAHGNLRQNVQYCGACHTAFATDTAVRPPEAGAPETIAFRVLIHKIHRGEELTAPFVVYGFGGTPHDFGETRFPGDLRACETCHVGEAWQEPSTAVCTSCHDGASAAAHAEINTGASGVESCEVCHGVGREFAVDAVHVPLP